MTLHLFLHNGKTLTFQDVTVENDTEHTLVADYVAVSDGRCARLYVRKAAIVAWSVKQ